MFLLYPSFFFPRSYSTTSKFVVYKVYGLNAGVIVVGAAVVVVLLLLLLLVVVVVGSSSSSRNSSSRFIQSKN